MMNSENAYREFIPTENVDRCGATLEEIRACTGHTCPRCGSSGHFRIHFLGKLKHPGACGWKGYMKTGPYIGHQLVQVLDAGFEVGRSLQDDSDERPGKGGKSIYVFLAFIGFFLGAVFRAAAAVVLISLHCIAALSQPGQTTADITTRVIMLAIILTGIGIGVYEIQPGSRVQPETSLPPAVIQAPVSEPSKQGL